MRRILAASLECLDGPEGTRLQRDHLPGSALDHLQCPTAQWTLLGLGGKLDAREIPRFARGTCDFSCRPTGLLRLLTQPTQDFELPPFLPMDSKSNRANTLSTCPMETGGERPLR